MIDALPQMTLLPGTRLGSYEVTAQIGVGGMGEVCRATDTRLGRQVAIKVWAPTQIFRDGVRLSFDLAPDGKRIVMFPPPARTQAEGSLHATFLLNFFDEVRRRIP